MSETVATDSRGRLDLGKRFRNSNFILTEKDGKLILEKIKTVAPKKNTSKNFKPGYEQ